MTWHQYCVSPERWALICTPAERDRWLQQQAERQARERAEKDKRKWKNV